jgi:hypothetical protein
MSTTSAQDKANPPPVRFKPHLIERFWSRVDKNGPIPIHRPELGPCWVFTGTRLKRAKTGQQSYGYFCLGKNSHILAHRMAWELENGPVAEGHVICHACDFPPCVRGSHLFDGTQAQNLADMRGKGRAHFNVFPTGEDHPNAKITPEKAAEARRLHESGLSCAKIGKLLGLHASTIHDIVTGKTWRAA